MTQKSINAAQIFQKARQRAVTTINFARNAVRKLISPGVNFTCPACFSEARLDESLGLCLNDSCRKSEDNNFDKEFEARWRRNPKTSGFAFAPPVKSTYFDRILGRKPVLACPKCNDTVSKRICKKCFWEISDECVGLEQNVFCLLGQKHAGKSHFLATLVHELQSSRQKQIDWLLIDTNDQTTEKAAAESQILYGEKRCLPPTAPGNVEPMIPMIYRVVDPSRQRPDHLLGFYDIAGEDLMSANVMHDFSRFLFRARGLVFFIDAQAVAKWTEASQNHDYTIMGRFVREYPLTKGQSAIGVPLAVVLSKADTVPELRTLLEGGPLVSNGAFSRAACRAHSDEVRDWLLSMHENPVLKLIEHSFAQVSYFAVSSLGVAPQPDRSVTDVSPRRVLDPFVWLLAHNQLIPRSE